MPKHYFAKNIIVKVQIPLSGDPQVLIYNQDRRYTGAFEYTKELKKQLKSFMNGQPKAYVYADVVEENDGCIFELNGPAPSQVW